MGRNDTAGANCAEYQAEVDWMGLMRLATDIGSRSTLCSLLWAEAQAAMIIWHRLDATTILRQLVWLLSSTSRGTLRAMANVYVYGIRGKHFIVG